MKDIKTLVQDIYALFNNEEHHEPSEANIEALGENIKDLVRKRLARADESRDVLRFSALGKPDRQIWYASQNTEGEKLAAKTQFKFLYGDVIEQLLIFLAKEAGHVVEREQEEIEVDGIKGHIDAIIDGVLVDSKSASPYSFKKFKNGEIYKDDPFGYIKQLSGYGNVLTPDKGAAFLVADKVHGDIALATVEAEIVKQHEPQARITHLKNVIESKEPPPRCYEDVPEGKSGNMKLGTNCSYCPFKEKCWSDANNGKGLRKFIYSTGPVWLTKTVKEPKVQEDFG